LASVAGTFPGFNRWAFACAHEVAVPPLAQIAAARVYQPLFFSGPHFLLVEHLAEMIIPADDTPGAKQAGVAEFIDFMVANRVPVSTKEDMRSSRDAIRAGEEIQEQFLAGLDWLNARSKSQFGDQFLKCSGEQQNSLLEELAYKSKYQPATESGREFFRLMRDYTVVGYYTTRIGLETLGYPGLRSVWSKMPGCSHPQDPEHATLREPAIREASGLQNS
jgi:hypothetical protein